MISQCVTVGGSRSYFVDMLHGLLKFDPADRLTAQQALDHPFFKTVLHKLTTIFWYGLTQNRCF
ncbi:putative dual-specificity kinase [Helianthus anomalus]